jgi:hypothetical protein
MTCLFAEEKYMWTVLALAEIFSHVPYCFGRGGNDFTVEQHHS